MLPNVCIGSRLFNIQNSENGNWARLRAQNPEVATLKPTARSENLSWANYLPRASQKREEERNRSSFCFPSLFSHPILHRKPDRVRSAPSSPFPFNFETETGKRNKRDTQEKISLQSSYFVDVPLQCKRDQKRGEEQGTPRQPPPACALLVSQPLHSYFLSSFAHSTCSEKNKKRGTDDEIRKTDKAKSRRLHGKIVLLTYCCFSPFTRDRYGIGCRQRLVQVRQVKQTCAPRPVNH